MDKVAVVILNWNGRKFLQKFLPGIVKFSNPDISEVYVADNASTDDSLDFIKENFPTVKPVILDKNYGFAEGYNRALKQISAKYFILLNSDVEVTKNWIDPMYNMLENDNSIAACMPKIKDYNNKDNFEYAGAAGGLIDKYGYTFCRGRIFNYYEKDLDQYNEEAEIFWATGACLFIRSELYFSTGGLDKDFFAHMEEIDLCWRIKNMGQSIVYTPDSTVYHIGGGTLPPNTPQKTFLNFRNNLYLLYKNLAPNLIFKLILLRLFLDGIAGVKFLISGEIKNFFAVIRAHFSFFINIYKFRSRRKENLARNIKYNHKEIYQGSIVYDFFVNKIKKYSDLNH